MKETTLRNKFLNAAKWSFITEIAARIISPLTYMILARIIAPEAFGVLASVTMIVSFADMFADAGFQKYLIQHAFQNEEEQHQHATVAFWTNLGIAALAWLLIAVFCEEIAVLVGSPGLGQVIAVASVELPLTAFSSIQMAVYRRSFDFRTLFFVRMVSVCLPFLVTIPLAYWGLSYWALIIGSVLMQIANAIILTIHSRWKPRFFYKLAILKEMLSFSIWSLIESISIWLTSWADIFIISTLLNQYYLGIYKTSTTMVNALMSLVTASTVPVLFSALSRLQDNPQKFNQLYFKTQRFVSVFIFPLGIGVYCYRDLATRILLGSKWEEASLIIGLWAVTSAIVIVFGYFCSEVYRASGKPNLSVLVQLSHVLVLIPVCWFSLKFGFWTLVYARAWIRLELVLVHFIVMKYVLGISIKKTITNVIPTGLSSLSMGALAYILLQLGNNLLWLLISILICIMYYFGVLYLFPSMQKDINEVMKKLNRMLLRAAYITGAEKTQRQSMPNE